MIEHRMPIPARAYNAAVGGHVCGPEDIDFGQKVVHLIKYDKDGNEVSFENQVTQANKIYVIHDDFTLSSNVTIPANCVLEFDGGSISGAYTLTGNNTQIKGNYSFNNVTFGGYFTNSKLDISNEHFTNIHFDSILTSFADAEVKLFVDINENVTSRTINIDGNGHTFTGNITCAESSTLKSVIKIKNLNIVGNIYSVYQSGEGVVASCSNKTLVIQNCKIKGYVYTRGTENELVEYTEFYNDFDETKTTSQDSRALSIYNNVGNTIVRHCHFHNLYGMGFGGIGLDNTDISVTDCVFEKTGATCIMFNGGVIPNLTIKNNIFKDANLNNEASGIWAEVLNTHGFITALIHDNYIDCPNAIVDCDGSDSTQGHEHDDRGHFYSFVNNNVVECKGLLFYDVKNILLKDNYMNFNGTSGQSVQLKARTMEIYNNTINSPGTTALRLLQPSANTGQTQPYFTATIKDNIIKRAAGTLAVQLVNNTNNTVIYGNNSIIGSISYFWNVTFSFLPEVVLRRITFTFIEQNYLQRIYLGLTSYKLYKAYFKQLHGMSRYNVYKIGYTRDSAAPIDDAITLTDDTTAYGYGGSVKEYDLQHSWISNSTSLFLYCPAISDPGSQIGVEIVALPDWCTPYV